MKLIKVLSYTILLNFLFLSLSYSEILKEIKINGTGTHKYRIKYGPNKGKVL